MNKFKSAISLSLLLITLSFSACHNNSSGDAAAPTSADTMPAMQAPQVAQDDTTWMSTNGMYAVFYTPKGKIVCKLEYTKMPMTVASFVSLAEGTNTQALINKGVPFYNGLTFHRVEPGFVIQGGDPNGNGSGSPGYQFANEVDPTLTHNRAGTLAMANAGPNTNGSQFYITLAPTPSLDGTYNVFGYVVAGQSVVNAITKGDKMDTVKIVRNGTDAQAFNAPKVFTAKMEEAKKKMADGQAGDKAAWAAKVMAKFPTAHRTPTGLYYVIDKQGTGPIARKGQTVVAHYTGTFWDGKKFDSSVDRGQPFEFPLGQHRVIAGWDEGFGLLKVGTKAKLIIPYYLAYGEQGMQGGIPPKADLIFDVEMLGVK